MFRSTLLLAAFCAATTSSAAAQAHAQSIEGAWHADSYVMKSGQSHPVVGHIFFADGQWTVLFFVTDGDGEPRRGSGEGGSYTLEGDRLVFTHLFNLSVGEAMAGLQESPLRMVARGADGAPTEETIARIMGDRLTLEFPSGNSMTFSRATAP